MRVTCTEAVCIPTWVALYHDFPARGSNVEFQRTHEAVGQAVWLGVHFARSRSDNLVIDAGETVLFAPFSGQCQMLFEDENEVLQATALRATRGSVVEHQPERCAQFRQVVRCFVRPGSLVVAWSPQRARASPSILKVKRSLPVWCVCTRLLYLF